MPRLFAPALVLVLAACAAPVAQAPTPVPTSSPTASPQPTPSPTPTPTRTPDPAPEPTSPLTGLPEATPQPVLTVKLDNTPNAQPHAGLDVADVVYIEEVEYGMTRLAVVFASSVPARIGPVRSARITDLDLLEQYGTPAFAFSGAQRRLWPAIASSSLIDISPNKVASIYSRDRNRRAPYNYFLDGPAGLAAAPDASATKNIGFTFNEIFPLGGKPSAGASVRWGGSSASFEYQPVEGDYLVNLNGERAEAEEHDDGQRASTVIIQYVKQAPSAYFDKGGGNTPKAETIGSGTALILRDGRAWDATWERDRAADGTRFFGANGLPLPLKPGQQWIVLMDEKRPATLLTAE